MKGEKSTGRKTSARSAAYQVARFSAPKLRTRTEGEARNNGHPPLSSITKLEAALQQLRVHKVELKMQNEHLRATQEELAASHERYVELYDFAPLGYITLDGNGNICGANLRAVAMLGMERSGLLSQPFHHFVFSADQDRYHLAWRGSMGAQDHTVAEVRLRPVDAPMLFARIEFVRSMENRKPVCYMAISDITKEKRAEEALREQERLRIRFEAEQWKQMALEAGGMGAWDQNLQTGKIVCSARACFLLGLPSDLSPQWSDIVSQIHPDDRTGFEAELEKSAHPKGPRRCDVVFRVLIPTAPVRWLRLLAGTFFYTGAEGGPSRRMGVLTDVTQQKGTEEWHKSRANHLDSLVRERTAKLQEAVSELEHFSYTLAHDLRAPLRVIAGYGAMLLKECTELRPKYRDFLERSNAAAQRMDSLIIDALNYNKIVAGNFELTPVDCLALLRGLVDSYPQFQRPGIAISIQGPFPQVMGTPALLTQCFSNLLDNALKFVGPDQQPAVRVSALDLGPRVRLEVADNGIGIDDEGQKKIFRMFTRLNQSYEGTGVGLALVRKAAERMHGMVGVRSAPGRGSEFWIELDKAPVPA